LHSGITSTIANQKTLWLNKIMDIPKTISSRSVYSNPYIDVKVDTLEFNGKQWEQAYFIRPNNDTVGILPISDLGIYLVSQYRYASKDYFWQIAMGQVDKNSTELDTATHELAEEVGFKAKDLQKIGTFNAEPGMSPAKTHIYLASGLEPVVAHVEGSEVGMKAKLFTFSEIENMIIDGRIICGFTLSAYLLYKLHSAK
jgi:ADP-ribose pyrophosphatase